MTLRRGRGQGVLLSGGGVRASWGRGQGVLPSGGGVRVSWGRGQGVLTSDLFGYTVLLSVPKHILFDLFGVKIKWSCKKADPAKPTEPKGSLFCHIFNPCISVAIGYFRSILT